MKPATWFNIPSDDTERASNFYEEVFGWVRRSITSNLSFLRTAEHSCSLTKAIKQSRRSGWSDNASMTCDHTLSDTHLTNLTYTVCMGMWVRGRSDQQTRDSAFQITASTNCRVLPCEAYAARLPGSRSRIFPHVASSSGMGAAV